MKQGQTGIARKAAAAIALTAIILSLAGLGYNLRAMLPYPMNYMTRLVWLNGYASQAGATSGAALNCSGFIANAHGNEYIAPEEFYQGAGGKLQIVAEVSDRSAIPESILKPGDVAAFHGAHVAAYLGAGIWIDSDARRGEVSKFRMQDKSQSDNWFAGPVRIVRWN